MSTWMGVILERGTFPDGLLPEGGEYGCGQDILRSENELSRLAQDAGLLPLDHFIVDHCGLIEEAGRNASPELQRIMDRANAHPEDEEAVREAMRCYDELFERVERGKPWFDPAEGLRTVQGLIRIIEAGIEPEKRERIRAERERHFLSIGFEPALARSLAEPPWLEAARWDLRTMEVHLLYAQEHRLRFHFGVSY